MKKSAKVLLSYMVAFLVLGVFTTFCTLMGPNTVGMQFLWYVGLATLCIIFCFMERQLSGAPAREYLNTFLISIVLAGIIFISEIYSAYSDHPDFTFGKLVHIAVWSGSFLFVFILGPVMSIILVASLIKRWFLRLLNSQESD